MAVPFNGDMGVDLFLLLSGYLIGGAVFKEIMESGSFQWIPFFIRRVFRIAPVFYLAVFLAAATQGLEACRAAWWRKLVFIENNTINLQDAGQCAPQSWSVGLEMQLYLMTPPMMMLTFCIGKCCSMPPARVAVAICGCVCVACCLARCTSISSVLAMSGSVWYTGTWYRCAPYAMGVAMSVLLAHSQLLGEHGDKSRPARVAARILHGMAWFLSWAILVDCSYFGGGGPLLGFESPMSKWPFSHRAAEVHFVLGRPLIGAASGYLLWRILKSLEPRLHSFLAAPIWRPLARLSYSTYMMQVVNFAVAGWILAPFGDDEGSSARAVSSLSEAGMVLLLYFWAVLYTLFAFTLAMVSYMLVEVPGMALGRHITLMLRRPARAKSDSLARPLV